ncbi:C-type mannose receptor 2, partial [Silurus meridionalis]
IRKYFYFSSKLTWFAAQKYCRQNYTDLATVTSDDENQRVMRTVPSNFAYVFIGFNRTSQGSNTWQWSDGEQFIFFAWKSGEPNNYMGNEGCGSITAYGWNDSPCSNLFPFLCEMKVQFVQENKTWDKALEYCRRYNKDLAYLNTEQDIFTADTTAAKFGIATFWTGLHFINGQWLWVNDNAMKNNVSLSLCPVQNYRCGARNSITRTWENRDCNEKLQFICN